MAGFLSPSTLEQIRTASNIVDVIGNVLPLKRAGTNFVALCPFHREKSPSFNVNPSKQIFRCFGCGKGGDVFTFIREYENISFMDAVRRLAERARIPIEFDLTPGAQEARSTKDSLLKIHDQITTRWQHSFSNEAGGEIARNYLIDRGVSEEAIKIFRIGYAPDAWDDTVNWAKSKGHDLKLVEQAGLILSKDDGRYYYDRFRGRLMFPICDEQGRVIAFSGRILNGDEKTGKYINSPETPIFSKGRVMFGLDKSKRAILDAGFALICEGQLDMIACFMAGIQNVIAPQGTALTPEHARILKRYTNEVVVCFDADSAGQKATVRAFDALLPVGLAIRVATIPAPDDPDSFIKRSGPEAFRDRLTKAEGFFDYLLQRLCNLNDSDSDKGRQEILKAMAEAVYKTGDAVVIDIYAQKTAARLGVSGTSAALQFKKLAPQTFDRRELELVPQQTSVEATSEEFDEPTPPSPQEMWLLKLLCQEDDILEWTHAHLDLEWIQHPEVRQLLSFRLHPTEEGFWPTLTSVLGSFETDSEASALLAEAAVTDQVYPNAAKQVQDLVLRLRNAQIDRRLHQFRAQAADPNLTREQATEAATMEIALRKAKKFPLQPLAGF